MNHLDPTGNATRQETDVEKTKQRLIRSGKFVIHAKEIEKGSYEITFISGQNMVINDAEMKFLCDQAKAKTPDWDFDIYYMNGIDTTARA